MGENQASPSLLVTLWRTSQEPFLRDLDYVPVVSSFTGPVKVVVYGTLGVGYSTVAGTARAGASIFYVAGDQERANRWQAFAGETCTEATKKFINCIRGFVSTAPVLGNGLLAGVDAYLEVERYQQAVTTTIWQTNDEQPQLTARTRVRPGAAAVTATESVETVELQPMERRRRAAAEWKAKVSNFLLALSLSDPSNVVEQAGALSQALEQHGLTHCPHAAVKSYKKLLVYLFGGKSPSRFDRLVDRPEGHAQLPLTLAELKKIQRLLDRSCASYSPLAQRVDLLLAEKASKQSETTDASEGSTTSTKPDESLTSWRWRERADNAVAGLSLADPLPGAAEHIRSLIADFVQQGLKGCPIQSLQAYKQLFDYLLAGEQHTLLEKLCNQFEPEICSPAPSQEELAEVSRLLEEANASGSPMAKEVKLLLKFAGAGLEPRTADPISYRPLVNAVIAKCSSKVPHRFSEATLRQWIAGAKHCPTCKGQLDPPYFEPDQTIRKLEAKYQRLADLT
jgi:hypothetical protein